MSLSYLKFSVGRFLFSIIFSLTLINYVIQVRVSWLLLYHQAQLETR